MASERERLHDRLVAAAEGKKVYFQPPNNISMIYPCIVYERAKGEERYANNSPYLNTMRYTVTVIDQDPDSEIPKRVRMLPLCSHSTFFVKDNLNHDVFDIFS